MIGSQVAVLSTLNGIDECLEGEIAVTQCILYSESVSGFGSSQNDPVISCGDHPVAILVSELIGPRAVAGRDFVIELPDSVNLLTVNRSYGMADEKAAGDQIIFPAVAVPVQPQQAFDFVFIGREIGRQIPGEAAVIDQIARYQGLKTRISDFTQVALDRGKTRHLR